MKIIQLKDLYTVDLNNFQVKTVLKNKVSIEPMKTRHNVFKDIREYCKKIIKIIVNDYNIKDINSIYYSMKHHKDIECFLNDIVPTTHIERLYYIKDETIELYNDFNGNDLNSFLEDYIIKDVRKYFNKELKTWIKEILHFN